MICPSPVPAFASVCVTFAGNPVKIAGLDFVCGGLAIGCGHFQIESRGGNDQVGAIVRVHRSDASRRDFPFVDAGAWIFARHRPGGSRGRMLRALEKFHVQHVKYSRTEIVNPVREWRFVQSAQRNIARLLFDGSAFRLVGELLRGAGVAEPDGDIIDGMDVDTGSIRRAGGSLAGRAGCHFSGGDGGEAPVRRERAQTIPEGENRVRRRIAGATLNQCFIGSDLSREMASGSILSVEGWRRQVAYSAGSPG